MLAPLGQPVYGEDERRLARFVGLAVNEMGRRWRRPGIFVEKYAQWLKPVGFTGKEIRGDREVLAMLVTERVTLAVKEADFEIQDRHGDPKYGYMVSACLDLTKQEGWNGTMPHYAVVLMWRGPRPAYWPHKVSQGDVDAAKVDDDDGYEVDYKDLCGVTPTEWVANARKARERGRRGKN